MAPIKRWTLVATIIASSMTFIDGTVINVALPALQRAMNASITDVQWVIEAYALFLGSLLLVGGSLGDQIGRKRVFNVGVVIFTVASLICGFAPTTAVLIAARAVQGVGGAMLVPGSLAIITATFEDADRGRAIGIWSGFSAITTALGPVGGGWLIEHVSWRAVFFINLPLAIVVLLLSVRFVPESKDSTRSGAIDWTGAALAVVALGALVLGFIEWPSLGGSHPVVLSSLAMGLVLFVLFVVVEQRVSNPMLPLGLFSIRNFTLTNALTFFLYAALAEMLFLVPMALIQVRGFTATAVGAWLLPFPVIMFALSGWSGGLVGRIGPRIPLTVGPVVSAIGLVLFAFVVDHSPTAAWILPAVITLGLGMAVTVAPLTTTVMNSVDEDHSGVASGVNNAVSRVAGLMAIAVLGVVVAHVFDGRVHDRLTGIAMTAETRMALDRELPKMAGANLSNASLSSQEQREARQAIDESFAEAFRTAMFATSGLAIVAALIGLGVKSRK